MPQVKRRSKKRQMIRCKETKRSTAERTEAQSAAANASLKRHASVVDVQGSNASCKQRHDAAFGERRPAQVGCEKSSLHSEFLVLIAFNFEANICNIREICFWH